MKLLKHILIYIVGLCSIPFLIILMLICFLKETYSIGQETIYDIKLFCKEILK